MTPRNSSRRLFLATCLGYVVACACALLLAQGGPPGKADGSRGLTDVEAVGGVANPGERWALLIGINQYQHQPPLQYCGHDVEVLREVLINHGGYDPAHVRVLSDKAKNSETPSKGNIIIALDSFLEQAKPDDTVLLAFSGHGACDKDKQTYLLPIDGLPKLLEDTAISMKRVNQYLEKCPARQKIVILDACHAGGSKGEDPAAHFDPNQLPRGKGIIQLCSCQVDELSWEDPEFEHGVFSYYLARAIEGEVKGDDDGCVSVHDVYDYLCKKVTRRVNEQHNHRQVPKILMGEFAGRIVLASRKAETTRGALSPEELGKQLEKRGREKHLSPELVSSARGWLSVDEKFAPARDVRLLLNLLARGVITQAQFQMLARERVAQLRSHQAAARVAGRGALRALVIGINRYGAGKDLFVAVSDAELFHEALTRNAAMRFDPKDVLLLTNEAAGKADVSKALARMTREVKKGDLFVLFFAGQDARVAQGDRANGWLLSGGRPVGAAAPASPHRGLEINVDSANILTMAELNRYLKDCLADIVIVSDTCFAQPDWPILFPGEFHESQRVPASGADPERPTRVFIGNQGYAIEDAHLRHGTLSFIVAKGLAGAADQSVPRFCEEKLSTTSSPLGRPDGFVTLRELALFLKEHQLYELPRKRAVQFVLQGDLGSHDLILTRSSLPVD